MALRDAPGSDEGHGYGTFTDDGCPVEMYVAMPHDRDAASIVHSAIPPGSSILELGCGTGRIAEPLADLGHDVTGVDSSREMLSRLVHTRPIHSRIEALDLAEGFDVVLLASTLINTANPTERLQFLDSASRHAKPGSVLLLERHAPSWSPVDGASSQMGTVSIQLRDLVWHDDRVMSATVIHRLGDQVARQEFSAEILDDAHLDACLSASGYGHVVPVSDDGRWVLSRQRGH